MNSEALQMNSIPLFMNSEALQMNSVLLFMNSEALLIKRPAIQPK
jgi:hypothetical protein